AGRVGDAESKSEQRQGGASTRVSHCVPQDYIGGKICGNFARSRPRKSPLTSTTVGKVFLSFISYGMQASIRIRLLKLPGRNSGSRFDAHAFWIRSMSILGSNRVHIAHSTWSSSPASISSSTTTVHLPA